MADSYSIQAVLSAVDRNFTGTFKQAEKTIGGIQNRTSAAGTSAGKFGAVMGAASTLVSAGMRAVGNGVRSMITELDDSSKAWQTFESNMAFLGKTPKEIASIEKSLQKYAQQTIYSSSDMASAYAQFAAVGVKGADKLVKGMGGLAAATDNPKQAMKTLMEQGTQMAAKPMVMWQDFRLMLEQTPAGMAAVAKAMGITTKELVTRVQDGKVSTEEFFAAVEKAGNSNAFQKMATSYKTVGEAMDGLTETVANKLQPAWQDMSRKATAAISNLIDWISEINFDSVLASIASFFAPFSTILLNIRASLARTFSGLNTSGFGKTIAGIGDLIKGAFGGIAGVINAVVIAVGGSIEKISGGFAKAFDFSKSKGTIASFKDFISNTFLAIQGAISSIGDVIAGLPWEAIFNGVRKALDGILAVLNPLVKAIADAFKSDVVRSFAAAIVGAYAGFKLFMGISAIVGTISRISKNISMMITIVRNLGGVFNALKMVMGFMSPTGWIIMGIAAVVAGLTWFFAKTKTGQKIWAAFVKFLQEAWSNIVNWAQSTWESITGFFSGAAKTATDTWQGVVDFFSNLWSTISDAANAAWTTISESLSTAWQAIVDVASTIWQGLVDFFSGIWNGIVEVATDVWNTFGTGLTDMWNGIVETATGIWELLKSVILGPILIVIDLLTGNWSQLGEDLSLIWESISSAASTIWDGIKTFFSGLLDTIATYFSVVWNGIVTTVTNIWNGVIDTGKNLWNDFMNFLSGLWDSVKTAATSAWTAIKSAVSSLITGTVEGAKNLWNGFMNFLANLWNSIRSAASNAWNGLKSTVLNIVNGIVSGARSTWNGLVKIVTDIVSNVKSAFNALTHIDLKKAGKAILQSFLDGLTSIWNKVKDFVGGIGEWIRKHKGPISYDRKLLIPAGNAIMNGLNAGLVSQFSTVKKNVTGMADQIAAAAVPSISAGDIAGTINAANRSINQGLSANVNSEMTVSQRPLSVTMNVNGTEWRGFVADITNTQDIQLQLES